MPAFIIIFVSSLVISGGIVLFVNISKNKLLEDIEKLITDKEYDSAEKAIQDAAKALSPFKQRFYMAQILEGKGQFKQAIESYEKSLLQLSASNYKQSFDIRVKVANLCFEANMIDKALGYYELILQTQKDHYDALMNTSDIYYMNKNFSRAKIQLEKVLLSKANDFTARLKLVKVVMKLNQYIEAGRQLREIIKHAEVPEGIFLEAKELLGEVFIEQKNYLEAIETFESLLVHDVILADHARMLKNLDMLLYALILKNEIQSAVKTFINFESMLKENEVYEIKYSMAQAMDKMRRMYPAILLLHSIYLERPNFRDVKASVDKYKEVLNNVYLKNIYDQEVIQSEQFIIQSLQLKSDVTIVSKENFFIFIDDEHANIVNRHLSPMTYDDSVECIDLLQKHKASRARIRIYSFDPLAKDDRAMFTFNSVEEITGKAFVDAMRPKPIPAYK